MIFPSCRNIAFLVINWKIWSSASCYGASEILEPCGIFVRDFHLISNGQADFLHWTIDHLQLKLTRPQSLIIQTELSQRDILPDIFRSMKYDCYLYVHINFVHDLFSTIPLPSWESLNSPVKSVLYKKALFLRFVIRNPFELFTDENRKLQLDRPYRLFVFRLQMTGNYYQNGTHQQDFPEMYFFCAFCLPGLVRLNLMTAHTLSATLLTFKTSWGPEFAEHYYSVYEEANLEDEKFCAKQNAMYMYRVNIKCNYYVALAQLIVFASGNNFTLNLKLYSAQLHLLKIPTLSENSKSSNFEYHHKYSSPTLRCYRHPSIIYCFNLRREAIADQNMWTKYVPQSIWTFVVLFVLTNAFLNTLTNSQKIVLNFLSQKITLFVNSCFKSVRVIIRQSWGHKWKLFGVLELLFSPLLSLYENSITVNVVVPLDPKSFTNTKELYNNNYTFVVQHYDFTSIHDWLSGKYNMANRSRFLSVKYFDNPNIWVEKFFMTQPNQIKYAIIGDLSQFFHFRVVTYLKERNDTCYQMYPPEAAFYSDPVYYSFPSAASSSMHKSVLFLQAHGFSSAFENAHNFRQTLLSLKYSRYLGALHGFKGTTLQDIKNSKLNDSMITLGNIKLVLFMGLLIILFATVSFVVEICSRKYKYLYLYYRSRTAAVMWHFTSELVCT